MLYKWKNVVLQMLLMRLCPSLTADQTRYLLPPSLFCTCLAGYFHVGLTAPPPPHPPHTHQDANMDDDG